MTARLRKSDFWRRVAFVLALAMVVPAVILTSQESFAQEQKPRPLRNFLQRLFFGNYPPRPPAQTRTVRPRKTVGKVRQKRSIKASPESQVAVVEKVEKVENARVVLVVGDFLGSGLAEGLAVAYAEMPGVRVSDRTRGSSGFVRSDYFNWPTEISPMLDAERPAAVVVMLGSNDRQQMSVGGSREEKRSEAWTKEYETRATALATAVREKNIPLIWVGMPAFKSSSLTSDMLAFNDLYRRVAENVKGEFVDIWDGFVDESGAFVMSGPDVNGQPVKLRSSDGINVTKAGKRKLAFYVEKPLSKILGDAVLPNGGAVGPQHVPDITLQPGSKPATDRTVPVSLTDPELDGGSELLGLKVAPKGKPGTPVERLTIEGIAADAAPGRADDFSGQEAAPAAAKAVPPGDRNTTAVQR